MVFEQRQAESIDPAQRRAQIVCDGVAECLEFAARQFGGFLGLREGFLGTLSVRDVARHLGCADQVTARIADRRNRDRGMNDLSVLSASHGLEWVDTLVPRESLEERGFL